MTPWMRPPWLVRWLVHVAMYAAALTMVIPPAWMVATSLKTDREAINPEIALLPGGAPQEWQWGSYLVAWQEANLGEFYTNSIIVATVVTVLSVVYNAMAGFAFAKLRFVGRRLTFSLTIGTMLLPMQVYFIFAYVICGRLGYVDSLQGLIVPFLASAFGVLSLIHI